MEGTESFELTVLYLRRISERVESINKKLQAGEHVSEAERIEVLEDAVRTLIECMHLLAGRIKT